jgi:SAM-dependent methyltransferase
VFRRGGEVLRILSQRGLEDWNALAGSAFFGRATGAGKLVRTEVVETLDGLPELPSGPPACVLRHEPVPVISYPYEWTFGMLRDAALLQLELMRDALQEGLILKDASPFNVQWRGVQPVFVDVGSFQRLREGEPWAGYRQFCMQMLFPLMLTAYRGIPHQPWLRGRLQGITPQECRSLMSFRDRLRRGTASHVFLHARLDRHQDDEGSHIGSELRRAGFHSGLIEANVKGLEKLVRRLHWEAPGSPWSGYGGGTGYTDEGGEAKAQFVQRVVESRSWGTVWDLGCNEGRFSRIAAKRAARVVAIDSDPIVVEGLYRALRREGMRSILPLTIDISDPSPALGWRGAEHPPLDQRGRPDLTLCLALIHHVAISDNVPLRSIVEWLADLGGAVVVEFADRDDPMAASLLARKGAPSNPDYRRDHFERCLSERFEIERREHVPPGTRTLYFARSRGASADPM